MQTKNILHFALVCLPICVSNMACNVVKFGNRNKLSDAIYKDSAHQKVYVDESEDSINVYALISKDSISFKQAFPSTLHTNKVIQPYRLTKHSFDIDLISVPVKIRPSNTGVPLQLSTNLSAALFVGLRKDIHNISYSKHLTGIRERKISNLGFSIGGISGFGNAAISPSSTASQIGIDYDGLVWLYGLNGIVGWNQLSIGLAVGKDILLDNNRKLWIYNNKLWYGITIGLNLN